ncbi:MAG: ribosome biogenesis GTPase YlqF [Firmicutes bacterium]|nr:ribosome biogenesis GTPase YlqF [Bacillota bacterium]
MTKSLRLIEENIKLCDAVIYVLDARAVHSCFNPRFASIILEKPCLMLLNKSDLADDKVTNEWLKFFEKKNIRAIKSNASLNNLKRPLIEQLKNLLSDKIKAAQNKGVNKTLRAMVIGVPNSGKSSIINSVAQEKRAVTGDRPGVTRGKQWLRLSENVELLDTPGTLWNSFEDQNIARHLAYIGSIKDDILDILELSLCLIEELIKISPQNFKGRYDADLKKPPVEILKEICKKRAFLLQGQELDLERGAKAVLDDFRKGKVGNISLEKVSEETFIV